MDRIDRKRTILVVDDETGFLTIMQAILPRYGYEVLTTSHGQDGLQMIYDYQPDLALLDDMLPGISGGDICLAVKNDPAVSHIPVVLYSAGPRVRDSEFIRCIGADAVLYKPFKTNEVVETIQLFLNQSRV